MAFTFGIAADEPYTGTGLHLGVPWNITVKFLNIGTPKKLCCNLPKIQTKRPHLKVFCQKDANGIANSEDPDQTAPLGKVESRSALCLCHTGAVEFKV